ncbi:protein of unknown function (plasmid) [Pseudorhizobium banfieldiae]|uniref:Uncharacterized protein n=1 Tax=Pseudorhizobium banfieldiae TaxID=1125847 RepID=L0NNE7_9HYPH|nr:protein of unknown function [Pseudorhizobium banfieldiae]
MPDQPDRTMQDAIERAVDRGKRLSLAWVGKWASAAVPCSKPWACATIWLSASFMPPC